MNQENLFDIESDKKPSGPVECLGMTFESDEARRTHFTGLLREKLKDPEFRTIEGFPIGTDEAILELSDPPYYTACPNPWLKDFVELWESQKTDVEDIYHREPFAADVSEGKNDPIYNAHSYHTKVPHKAIMRYILHYTKPGDIVFDGFCGTGMTGVAARLCGSSDTIRTMGLECSNDTQTRIVDNVTKEEFLLGERKSIVSDLSPVASFIAHNYSQVIDEGEFSREADRIGKLVRDECGWMYSTLHTDGHTEGLINCVIWSDVFSCNDCEGEFSFWEVSLDHDKGKAIDAFPCPHCAAELNKKKINTVWNSEYDNALKKSVSVAKQVPALIVYTIEGKKGRFRKVPDSSDLELISKIKDLTVETSFPIKELPDGVNTSQPKNSHGVSHVHHFYTKRNLYTLGCFQRHIKDSPLSNALQYQLDSLIIRQSRRTRLLVSYFFNGGGGWVGTPLSGTLYIPSFSVEVQPFETWENRKSKTLERVRIAGETVTSTSSMSDVQIDNESIDYIFIDPPFGANINYSELNILWEAWLGVETNNKREAIENKKQHKTLDDYRHLMTLCFKECFRVLKSGRWMTVEFSNTKASVWNSIQTAINEAGFVVANVSGLDKKQGSFKAITTTTAVKQDLVISAYKPSSNIEDKLKSSDVNGGCWEFIKSHLSNLTVVKFQGGELVKVPERDPRILFDQLVSYCIRIGIQVPFSSQEFQSELTIRFIERDGMYFLPDQVVEYDKKRAFSSSIKQLSVFVDDEASAIEWMREELKTKPKTYSEIHPLFLSELSGWKKNELALELSTLLEQNFLKYDGKDDVPSQIHTYLSTNFKDMRGLDKSDVKLTAKAKDRWYVPDPNKAADLEKVRLRALLKEFETYKAERKKIKQPRAEALRAGFNTAWEAQDFQTILDISAKIPPAVLQEDEKLLMFYDNALTLTSTEDDEW